MGIRFNAAKAERILGEALARLGWTEQALAVRRKSDTDKLRIAARLRRETVGQGHCGPDALGHVQKR